MTQRILVGAKAIPVDRIDRIGLMLKCDSNLAPRPPIYTLSVSWTSDRGLLDFEYQDAATLDEAFEFVRDLEQRVLHSRSTRPLTCTKCSKPIDGARLTPADTTEVGKVKAVVLCPECAFEIGDRTRDLLPQL